MTDSARRKRLMRKRAAERANHKSYKCKCGKPLSKTVHHWMCNACWNVKNRR